MTDIQTRIDLLEKELDEARERILILETELGIHLEAPIFLGLTTNEAIIFGVLMKRDIAIKRNLITALYGHLSCDKEIPSSKIVDVFVCKMRKKLKTYGINVETVWGQGWRIIEEEKARVQEMIDLDTNPKARSA